MSKEEVLEYLYIYMNLVDPVNPITLWLDAYFIDKEFETE